MLKVRKIDNMEIPNTTIWAFSLIQQSQFTTMLRQDKKAEK